MRKVAIASVLTLSLSILNASVANAFGIEASDESNSTVGDYTETAAFSDSILNTQKSAAEVSQDSASTLSNSVIGLLPQAQLASLSEGFSNVSSLASAGWVFRNNSGQIGSPAQGVWSQGNISTSSYGDQEGGDDIGSNAFAQVGVSSTSSTGRGVTISNWLITPELDFSNGGTLSFFARTLLGNSRGELIEVLLSNAGTSTDVGTTPTSVGAFTKLVGTAGSLSNPAPANANLPSGNTGPNDTVEGWRKYTFNVAAGTNGRLAFRYFATNGGITGTQAQYATIDTVGYIAAVPEPISSSLAGFTVLGLVSYFKSKHKRTTTGFNGGNT
jgi:hypothetical protein